MKTKQIPKRSLTLVGILVASLSGVALILHAFLNVHIAFTVIVMILLTVLLLAAAIAQKRFQGREVLLQRIFAGVFAGFMGMIAYDLIRWVIMISGIVPFNPFRAIEVFGLLIMKTDVDSLPLKEETLVHPKGE